MHLRRRRNVAVPTMMIMTKLNENFARYMPTHKES